MWWASHLKLQPIENGSKYRLLEDYFYEINGYNIRVPKGFVTDLASIPKIMWNIFPPFGEYTPAAVVHDFLYSSSNNLGLNRFLSDKIFLFIMKELGVGFFKRNLMYKAVRMFGTSSWQKKIENNITVEDNPKASKEYYKIWKELLKF